MKTKRFTLLLAGMLSVSASFATDYYVSVDGAGTKDGSSWENAIDFASMYGKINDFDNGDVFYFQGGTYVPTAVTVITNKGYSFIGASTGTPTVFSGDLNGDGVANAGDANGLIAIQMNTINGNKEKHFVLKDLTFTGACITSEKNGALKIDNSGWVDVDNCIFDGNKSTFNGSNDCGGAACWSYRSTVNFKDCQFVYNESYARGGAVKLTSNNTDKSIKGYTTFERCLFANNSANNMGSAIFFNTGMELNIVNSVIKDNISGTEGEVGAIFTIGVDNTNDRQITIVNSIIAGNTGGAQVLGRKDANIRIANSIIVGDGENPAISISGTPKQMLSAGYNVIGKYNASGTPSWKTSDLVSDDNTLSSIFGANAVTDGPESAPYGATAEQLSAAVKDWNITQDLTVDMNGNPRGEVSVPGAVVAEPIKGNFTITDAKYATYYNDLGFVMPSEVKGGVVTDTKADGTLAVDYKYSSGSVVPAKSALLLKGAEKNYEVSLKLEETTEDANLLKGTSEEATTTSASTDAKFYKLANGSKGIGFYWASENGAAFINSANRAYLVVGSEVNAAKSFVFDDSVTDIGNIEVVLLSHPKVYNLQGVEVIGSAHLAKGVYIINGKKVIIK